MTRSNLLVIASFLVAIVALFGFGYIDQRAQTCTIQHDVTFGGRPVLAEVCKGGYSGFPSSDAKIVAFLD